MYMDETWPGKTLDITKDEKGGHIVYVSAFTRLHHTSQVQMMQL